MATPAVLAEIRRATRPHGVATGQQLRLTKRQRDYACETKVLVRVHQNVFVDPALPRTPEQDLMVAITAAGRGASAWGPSAAVMWQLLDEHPAVPHVVVPLRKWARVKGAVVRRSSDLCADHVMVRQGIPVTKPLITAVDLGAWLDPMDLADVFVRARQLKLFEPSAVGTTISRLARPGRNGIRTARDALDLVMIGDRPADSILELRFHHGVGRQLPPYEYQWEVMVRGRKVRIDFAYPSVKLAIELDGYDKRRSRDSLRYDAARGRLLLQDGWTVPHYTWDEVSRDPGGVASEILGLLRALGYRSRG
ncbi:MAG TPA: DUF559 domain-containing protein [Acidimicrobiales bacterium]|nr:DUF559 domain-containing protein [Acidimicrobiales bacterium]